MDTGNTAYRAASPIHPSLEPVQHLSEKLQRKLLKRAKSNASILEVAASHSRLSKGSRFPCVVLHHKLRHKVNTPFVKI